MKNETAKKNEDRYKLAKSCPQFKKKKQDTRAPGKTREIIQSKECRTDTPG